jgi:hypothetical protein
MDANAFMSWRIVLGHGTFKFKQSMTICICDNKIRLIVECAALVLTSPCDKIDVADLIRRKTRAPRTAMISKDTNAVSATAVLRCDVPIWEHSTQVRPSAFKAQP